MTDIDPDDISAMASWEGALSLGEVASIVRLVQSRIEVSLERLLH
jgi:hypothetical protein